MRNAPSVYVAGPLFDPGERWYVEQVEQVCADLGYKTYLPHRDTGFIVSAEKTMETIYETNRQGLEPADLVVAVLNGPDVDTGTAWEIGFACVRGIPVIGVHEDVRLTDAASRVDLMIYYSAQTVCDSLDGLRRQLQCFLETWS